MSHRSRHGNARKHGIAPVLETKPFDEQPDGVPAHADDTSRAAADEAGPFAAGNKRSVLGGRSRKGKPRMVERISMQAPTEDMPTHRYHAAARGFVRATSAVLARTIGGGQLDPHVGYLVIAAGRAAKWANYFSDAAERLPAGSKEQRETAMAGLAADERASTHLRNAHEYAARMAEIREARKGPSSTDAPWLVPATETTP